MAVLEGERLGGEAWQGLEHSDESLGGNAAGPEHDEAHENQAPDVRVLSGLHGGAPYGRDDLVHEPYEAIFQVQQIAICCTRESRC